MIIKNLKIYLGLLIILASCVKEDFREVSNTEQDLIEVIETDKVNGIPYAKNSTLNRFKGDDFISVKFSRKAALLEIQDFKKELKVTDSSDLRLSEKPVVIFDFDNTPKFYEFIVLDKTNKAIGTVSCFVKKEAPALIAFVLPYVRDYKHENALLFTAAYPNISKNIVNTSARGINSSNLQEESIEYKEGNKSFWSKVNKSKAEFMNSTISELRERQKNITPAGRAWNNYYTIPGFNANLQRTRFRGDCGPAALAWAYRGLYTTYNNRYIPIAGDSWSLDNDENIITGGSRPHYKEVEPGSVGYSKLLIDLQVYKGLGKFKNATTPLNMNRAVADIFPNHIIIPLEVAGGARNAIERGNPVYLLVKSGNSLHYLIAFGTKKRYTKFWIGGTHLTDSWLLVTDNGSTTSSHNYLPYYRNSHRIIGSKNFVKGEFVRK